MKAVIMAGGKGSRLRPLTCNLPKPMVPLLQKPVMEYAIEWLKKHGINEIAVTLQYLPQAIKNYFGNGQRFGVHLYYFEEKSPLGTAGSIKNAEEFFSETFIVVSGDTITDFNLQKCIDYHKEKKALATLLLNQVENPTNYGVVRTNQYGKITRFIEKPNWHEVFSNLVNTGIYILEPEIFSYIKKGVMTDFSHDLFPLLLDKNKEVYGYEAKGYWSDIGTLEQYCQTQYDLLDGKVHCSFYGKEIKPGVWIGKNVTIEKGAIIKKPVYLADNVTVRSNALIGTYSVVGRNTVVSEHSSLKKSIVWNRVFIGNYCELRSTTVANDTYIDSGALLLERSVIGDHCKISLLAVIQPTVKLWPNKVIDRYACVYTSVVRRSNISNNKFIY